MIRRDDVEALIKELQQLALRWDRNALRPRADRIADIRGTLSKCSSELREVIKSIGDLTQLLTPAEFASRHKVTEQTVTRWIRGGHLPAQSLGRGYLIHRDSLPTFTDNPRLYQVPTARVRLRKPYSRLEPGDQPSSDTEE